MAKVNKAKEDGRCSSVDPFPHGEAYDGVFKIPYPRARLGVESTGSINEDEFEVDPSVAQE